MYTSFNEKNLGNAKSNPFDACPQETKALMQFNIEGITFLRFIITDSMN